MGISGRVVLGRAGLRGVSERGGEVEGEGCGVYGGLGLGIVGGWGGMCGWEIRVEGERVHVSEW